MDVFVTVKIYIYYLNWVQDVYLKNFVIGYI
jgi:hypothetical protein